MILHRIVLVLPLVLPVLQTRIVPLVREKRLRKRKGGQRNLLPKQRVKARGGIKVVKKQIKVRRMGLIMQRLGKGEIVKEKVLIEATVGI